MEEEAKGARGWSWLDITLVVFTLLLLVLLLFMMLPEKRTNFLRSAFGEGWVDYQGCLAKWGRKVTGRLEGCRGRVKCEDGETCMSGARVCGSSEEGCYCTYKLNCLDGDICSDEEKGLLQCSVHPLPCTNSYCDPETNIATDESESSSCTIAGTPLCDSLCLQRCEDNNTV